jgi:hypothetical protein
VYTLFTDFNKSYDSVRNKNLYNILIEFGICIKLVRLAKMSLNGTYSRVRVGKYLSHVFPVKKFWNKEDVLSPSLVNFALEYAIKRVQVNQVGLKLNGKHQLFVYADDVNRVGRSLSSVRKNTRALVATSEVNGLEVNADKTKYMVTSRDQNAGRSHSIYFDNSSFEMVEEFK